MIRGCKKRGYYAPPCLTSRTPLGGHAGEYTLKLIDLASFEYTAAPGGDRGWATSLLYKKLILVGAIPLAPANTKISAAERLRFGPSPKLGFKVMTQTF